MASANDIWWNKRSPRSVDYLKLWKDNPRFDGAESHLRIKVADFADEILTESTEKKHFQDLVKSIVSDGFKTFDPIVVWKDESDSRYIIAEGNRRVLALKLLRSPHKAPKEIRKFMLQQASMIDRNTIEKIPVAIAPSKEDTIWYVLERHSSGSSQFRWQRLQQQRFIQSLYDDYNENVDLVVETTNFTRSDVLTALRYVQFRDHATRKEVLQLMTPEEKELIYSRRISMTVLERWFGSEDVRQAWGIEFHETQVKIKSIESSFLHAYAHFLKFMFNIVPNDLQFVVNTRSIPSHNIKILQALPEVEFLEDCVAIPFSSGKSTEETSSSGEGNGEKNESNQSELGQGEKVEEPQPDRVPLNTNNRRRVIPLGSTIKVKSHKLNALFREMKRVPVYLYTNVSAATLRVILDLSVDSYIKKTGLEGNLAKTYKKDYNHTVLLQRLTYLKNEHIQDGQAKKVIAKLLQPQNEHSLDTLNSFVHGHETHKIDHRFINGFWDMLTPLLKVLIDLKER
ncbi:ParB/Srx family N-terminal domain-containing protein [Vibrio sp. DW001]|uniref:ParB/Srx family N-terminal domain-containing protein n=1 Tax=Vibrio sp. DW001 TaxID=2912315 RepID=UPI0023B0A432|nr:ParB/Srx family N-terminal domain-containing protein [Vibrio sp. DW001]WED29019.1 ParB/Srx family N-terminal domain-containing protein [Vibrio sp. DW001]